eukprot:TRINITY_DN46890_c0_g1_i1.p1 TRINITY_DN46890_c0_g1~~TRINITY_DN46890_c0_g1_i1.p1  ORF type:complete len:119 (-),score=49.12 TRINITY_DN46890_c0_g1_i1:161-517(-)
MHAQELASLDHRFNHNLALGDQQAHHAMAAHDARAAAVQADLAAAHSAAAHEEAKLTDWSARNAAVAKEAEEAAYHVAAHSPTGVAAYQIGTGISHQIRSLEAQAEDAALHELSLIHI